MKRGRDVLEGEKPYELAVAEARLGAVDSDSLSAPSSSHHAKLLASLLTAKRGRLDLSTVTAGVDESMLLSDSGSEEDGLEGVGLVKARHPSSLDEDELQEAAELVLLEQCLTSLAETYESTDCILLYSEKKAFAADQIYQLALHLQLAGFIIKLQATELDDAALAFKHIVLLSELKLIWEKAAAETALDTKALRLKSLRGEVIKIFPEAKLTTSLFPALTIPAALSFASRRSYYAHLFNLLKLLCAHDTKQLVRLQESKNNFMARLDLLPLLSRDQLKSLSGKTLVEGSLKMLRREAVAKLEPASTIPNNWEKAPLYRPGEEEFALKLGPRTELAENILIYSSVLASLPIPFGFMSELLVCSTTELRETLQILVLLEQVRIDEKTLTYQICPNLGVFKPAPKSDAEMVNLVFKVVLALFLEFSSYERETLKTKLCLLRHLDYILINEVTKKYSKSYPILMANLMQVLLKVATLHEHIGARLNLLKAQSHYETLEAHYGHNFTPERLAIMRHLANVHAKLGNVGTRKELLERTLAGAKVLHGADSSVLLATMSDLIQVYEELKAFERWKSTLKEAAAILVKLGDKKNLTKAKIYYEKLLYRLSASLSSERVKTKHDLAIVYAALGNQAAQRKYLEEALSEAKELKSLSSHELVVILDDLIQVYEELKEENLQEKLLLEVLEIERSTELNASNVELFCIHLQSLSIIYARRNKFELHSQCLKEALRHLAKVYGTEDHPLFAMLSYDLAQSYALRRKLGKAIKIMSNSYEALKRERGESDLHALRAAKALKEYQNLAEKKGAAIAKDSAKPASVLSLMFSPPVKHAGSELLTSPTKLAARITTEAEALVVEIPVLAFS